ncbi:MAG: hypothetical protein EOO43_18505, partial [Flavobacterium sp.]
MISNKVLMNPFGADNTLSFYCKSHSSFKTHFGILSLYKIDFPYWLEKILLSIEYIQLLSLTILVHPNIPRLADSNTKNPFLFDAITYFMKIINPSYLLSFDGSNDSTTYSILAIILGFTFVKYLVLIYMVCISCFHKKSNTLLQVIWRWIFKFQGRILCCFITSFCVRTIANISNNDDDNGFHIPGITSGAIIPILAVMIAIEYLISFILETQFCDFIPTRQYSSGKNCDMQIFTLTQKLMIQIIQMSISENITGNLWVCIVLNLILSTLRGYRFFTTLPLYNYQSLLHQGYLTMIVLSLHFAHLFQQILISAEYSSKIDFRFLIYLWAIIGLMGCMLSKTFLKQAYLRLLTSYNKEKNPQIQLHKIFATKYLIRNKAKPSRKSDKMDIKHLLA